MRRLPDHLFVSNDGGLYDTRVSGWSALPALRPGYARYSREIETFAHVKAALRDTGATFGYTPYFITNDSAVICEGCARANLRLVCDSVTHNIRDGWRVTGTALTNADDYLPISEGGNGVTCDHCNEWIAEPAED